MTKALPSIVACLVGSMLALAPLASGCGGDKPEAKTPDKEVSMEDALALLPGNPIGLGTVDARAFFGSQHFGADLAKVVERYVPIGQEAGFVPSRDVDRVTFGSYSYQGIDVAAIVVGRFDGAKIKQVAQNQAPTKGGGTLVMSQYAGRDVYTVNNIGFSLLSDQRAIVGTETGIRRVLERIKDKRVQRDIPSWMVGTIETPGAAVAVAGDFASQPIPAEALRSIPSGLTRGIKAARVVGSFKDGVQIAGSLTYADAAGAEAAVAELKSLHGQSAILMGIGVQIRGFEAKVEKTDVQVTAFVDDQSLRALFTSVTALLGGPK